MGQPLTSGMGVDGKMFVSFHPSVAWNYECILYGSSEDTSETAVSCTREL